MFIPLRDDNPTQRLPVVTFVLIGVNVLVQLYVSFMSPERAAVFIGQTGTIPLEIVTLTDLIRFPDHQRALVPIPLTILTSMFVHGGWLHLGGNMWYLWLFGDNIEDTLGRPRFVFFYLLSGVFAAALQVAVDPQSTIPMVGASGAVAGVLGAYALRFPRARVHTLLVLVIFFTFIEVPALIVLGAWFLMQLWSSVTGSGGGVAWFAHIGGFVAGMGMIALIARRPRPHERQPTDRFIN